MRQLWFKIGETSLTHIGQHYRSQFEPRSVITTIVRWLNELSREPTGIPLHLCLLEYRLFSSIHDTPDQRTLA